MASLVLVHLLNDDATKPRRLVGFSAGPAPWPVSQCRQEKTQKIFTALSHVHGIQGSYDPLCPQPFFVSCQISCVIVCMMHTVIESWGHWRWLLACVWVRFTWAWCSGLIIFPGILVDEPRWASLSYAISSEHFRSLETGTWGNTL